MLIILSGMSVLETNGKPPTNGRFPLQVLVLGGAMGEGRGGLGLSMPECKACFAKVFTSARQALHSLMPLTLNGAKGGRCKPALAPGLKLCGRFFRCAFPTCGSEQVFHAVVQNFQPHFFAIALFLVRGVLVKHPALWFCG